MITCKEMCDFIARYLDGDLTDEQRQTFDLHLKLCPPCKDYIESYREAIDCTRKACCHGETKSECRPVPESLVKAILEARRK